MFHILFPYKLFLSLSSRAYKGSRIGTIKALTLSSPNMVNESALQTLQRDGQGNPSCEFCCGPWCRHRDTGGASRSPVHPHQRQSNNGRKWPEIELFSQKLWAESRFFFLLVTSKNTSTSFPKSGWSLHHNSLGKCRRRRFATFCESELNRYRKWTAKTMEKDVNSNCYHSTEPPWRNANNIWATMWEMHPCIQSTGPGARKPSALS